MNMHEHCKQLAYYLGTSVLINVKHTKN